MVNNEKVAEFVATLKNTFLKAADLVTEWGVSSSDAKIPSEKLVKDSLDEKVNTTDIFDNGVFTVQNTKANGTISRIWNETDGGGTQIIDGTSDVKAFVGVHEGGDGSNIYVQNYAIDKTTKTGSRITINENGAYYTANKSTPTFTASDEILTRGTLNTAIDGLGDDYYTKDQIDAGYLSINDGAVTVEKQVTAESGYASTYVIKQGGQQVGAKINIAKDLLLKSASKEVVGATPNALEVENNLSTGDVYLKFIVNTEDNDNEQALVVDVSDMVDNVTYTADEDTLTLSQDNEFSIKSEIVASWLDEEDVENTVEDYLEAIAAGLEA